MKAIALVTVLLASLTALAEKKEMKDPAEVKERMLKHIDERISDLQSHRSCVSGAKTHEDLKKCRSQMKEKRKAMKEKFKEWKKDRKGKKS